MSHDSSLELALRAVEPALRLIPERYLRQVLQYLIDWGHPLPTNPKLPYWVSRADLDAGDLLPPRFRTGTESHLLLVTEPDDRLIDRLPMGVQLREYWRVLFQAAAMRAIDQKIEAGTLTVAGCSERLERFGRAAAREIASVLVAEHIIPAEADPVTRYRAFAATYLDLAAFGEHSVEFFFPSLPRGEAVARMLAEDVDGAGLLKATCPEGAAERPHGPVPDPGWEPPETPAAPLPPAELTPRLGRALAAEEKGNNVRAAILRTQVARNLSGEERDGAITGAKTAIGKLVDALGDVFSWDSDHRQEWRQALAPLLEPAAQGTWPRAARCLYELQKIPADLAREVYAVDLPEYLRTFGRQPVKRPLPRARPVLILMSLKKACAQMLRAGLEESARLRIDRLFCHQIHAVEHDIRQEFGPLIVTALADAGLTPANTVEEVARDKLVAELLDRICERGYLRVGNLRDAIARNRLKMNDLSGPGEFFGGDALLRADLKLADALDGVYRKGEVYLRGIQRLSALFFGTRLGRLFTLYVAAPFGGAFLSLMFMEHLYHVGVKLAALAAKPAAVAKQTPPPQPVKPPEDYVVSDEVDVDDEGNIWINEVDPNTITSDDVKIDEEGNPFWVGSEQGAAIVTDVFTSTAEKTPPTDEHATVLTAWPTIVGLGVFLLFMFHVAPFRRAVLACLGYLWWVVRGVLWDIPMSVWRSRTVRGVRQSRPVRFLVRHFWSPLLITLLLVATMLLVGFSPLFVFRPWLVFLWGTLTLAYNSPWGSVIQDRIAEAVSDWWRLVRVNLIPGLITTFIDLFKRLANWVERKLYAVDEWLRYRGGDSQRSLAMKAVLGLLWFPIAYFFRFAFYLLIEPQVNPVKHFPVVTVGHKVIWPMIGQISEMTGLSMWTTTAVVNGIPGIFGFIAWELKENWRLYKTNRAPRLRPVALGSHGESMRGLLRPGFHSGTVPKLFRKLRHAQRGATTWLHHDLEHVAEGVHRFAERELLELLLRTPDWGGIQLQLAPVRFGCQRLVLELAAPSLGHDPFVLAFENVDEQIEASVEQVGWADKLTVPQSGVFVAALRGFLDMAAVERLSGRERVEESAPLGPGFADLARRVSWAEWVERWGPSQEPDDKTVEKPV